MLSMTNTPPAFGFSAEAVREGLLAAVEKREIEKRDPRICKCGHAARSHSSEGMTDNARMLRAAGRFACNPGRQRCPCLKFEPVMTTSDTRKFIYKTDGPAEAHALARGAIAGWDKGLVVEWLPGVTCDGCHQGGLHLIPLALDRQGRELHKPGAINKLFCADCRARLAASHLS